MWDALTTLWVPKGLAAPFLWLCPHNTHICLIGSGLLCSTPATVLGGLLKILHSNVLAFPSHWWGCPFTNGLLASRQTPTLPQDSMPQLLSMTSSRLGSPLLLGLHLYQWPLLAPYSVLHTALNPLVFRQPKPVWLGELLHFTSSDASLRCHPGSIWITASACWPWKMHPRRFHPSHTGLLLINHRWFLSPRWPGSVR